MRKLRAFFLRILSPLRARKLDQDFNEELESHIALHTDDGVRSGLSPEQARRQALVYLGGSEQARQAQRERRSLPGLESVLQDTRYGLRMFRRSPGFTLVAVVTLALGIGSCSAIFSLVDAVLLKSLPYGDPKQLVYLFTPNKNLNIPPEVVSPGYADFFDLKRQNHSFGQMTAFEQAKFSTQFQGAAKRIGAARVDENFFTTLDSPAEFGRTLTRDDNQPGHEKVVVISHLLWQSMFAGAANVLERSVVLNDESYRIVGVMPPAFQYPSVTDLPYGDSAIKATLLWVPLALTNQQKAARDAGNDVVLARLLPGVSKAHAQSEMSTMMVRLDALHTDMHGWGALVKGFLDTAIGPVRPLMWLLLGAVTIVLLIACGNTASLLLARATNRTQELGVRAALGAGRARVVRQLLTESLMIGAAASILGVGLAALFVHVLPRLDPGNIPRLNDAHLDARVLLFTVAVSLATSLLAGVLPALRVSRTHLASSLSVGNKQAGAAATARSQSALIVLEAALVVVLLACSGLLIRSYINVESVQTGFSRASLSVPVSLAAGYPGARETAAWQNITKNIRALPGVDAVGAITNLPLSNSESVGFFWVQGYPNKANQLAEGRSVVGDYFSAMNIPLVAGRLFQEGDEHRNSHVTIVNQAFARTYLANRNPIGARITGDEKQQQWDTVIGVVGDVRHTSMEEDPQPQTYNPGLDNENASVVVRTALSPAAVAAEIRDRVRSIDATVEVGELHSMGDLVSVATARRRFQTFLLTFFAGIALFLAVVGLYALIAYWVSRRSRELGVRMALGAQRRQILSLVMRKAGFLLAFGLILGLGGSWVAMRLMRAFLFGVREHDPFTILSVSALLAVTGLLAALVPAGRAASIDPMQALRTE